MKARHHALGPSCNQTGILVFGTLFLSLASFLSAQPVPSQADSLARSPSVKASSASSLIVRTLDAFEQITNLTASVDINTVDHRASTASPTLAKEGWRFMRNGQTNTFTRTRYLPFAGREVIESTNYSGGKLVAEKSVALPDTASLPGFEMYNLLATMRATDLIVESSDGDSVVFSATPSPAETLKVWISRSAILPFRIEKRRGEDLALVYTRTSGASEGQVLPLRDVVHFYERGRVTVTITRYFFNVQELSAAVAASAAPSTQEK